MGLLLVGGVAVVAFLLWRLLGVQTQRAQIEAAQLQVQSVNVATQVATSLVQRIEQHRGGYQKAKDDKRLIEWIDEIGRMLNADDAELSDQLHSRSGADTLRDLVAESFSRGVPCRLLQRRDYDALTDFPTGFPGRHAPAALTCPSCCDQQFSIDFPPGTMACPFCGEMLEPLYDDDDARKWREESDAWSRFRELFPAEAQADETQHDEAEATAKVTHDAEYAAALAAHAKVAKS